MGQSLRVLIVEDNENDALLLLREFKRGGYEVSWERVFAADTMSAALERQKWDIIVADYSMPSFSAPAALELINQAGLDIPVIVISGSVSEEVAVETMRAGAHDIMSKGQLARFLPAVKRELADFAVRAAHAEAERRLLQAQKMEAIGQLTGGIAHDFNNLLAVIVSNIEMLLDLVEGNSAQTELGEAALNSALRGAALTKRLLAFARQQPLASKLVAINDHVPGIVEMLKRTLGESVSIETKFALGLWPLRIDPSQFEDAVINLSINARDAMPNGGSLTLETKNVQFDEDNALLHVGGAQGDFVVVSVTDTGMGMPPEVIERALEPFFTTKPIGKGTGLGLSMVYGFTKQSNGFMNIYSEQGVGTTIRLYLPRAKDGSVGRPDDGESSSPKPTGGESILVVDDNVALRKITVKQLTSLGYKIAEAGSGPEGLALLNNQRFDMLLTDIGLPDGMNGYDLADQAVVKQPGIKVLFVTGYANSEARNGQHNVSPEHFLSKPYRAIELAAKVRALLDEK